MLSTNQGLTISVIQTPQAQCFYCFHQHKSEFIPGSGQGQAGWVSEQHGLVEGVSAHGRGVGIR